MMQPMRHAAGAAAPRENDSFHLWMNAWGVMGSSWAGLSAMDGGSSSG